jgi:hypothetical protein
MEVCGSLIDVCTSFKELRADAYSLTRNTIWLNCHCGGQFEREYLEAKTLMASIDSFRKKMKNREFDRDDLDYNLCLFKEELKENIVKLRDKCLKYELPYT